MFCPFSMHSTLFRLDMAEEWLSEFRELKREVTVAWSNCSSLPTLCYHLGLSSPELKIKMKTERQ